MRRNIRRFIHKAVNTFLHFCMSKLFLLQPHLLHQRIQDILDFGAITALDTKLRVRLNTTINAAYRHTSKRHVTRMYIMDFRHDQTQSITPWEGSCKRNNISTNVSRKKTQHIEKD